MLFSHLAFRLFTYKIIRNFSILFKVMYFYPILLLFIVNFVISSNIVRNEKHTENS